MQLTPDGKTMVYTAQIRRRARSRSTAPRPEAAPDGAHAPERSTCSTQHQLTPLEEFWVDGAEGAQVQSFVVKPPNFDPDTKYPVLMLIHGGPQGAWGHGWSYRWNAQVFAAAGYVVVMPNPRGSTGYGQKFIDEINSDWGGRAFDDIMAVTDYVVSAALSPIGSTHDRGRRLLRRLHGGLDSGPHAALQGADLARRRLRSGQRIRRHRRAVVPAVGVRRHALGQARDVRASGRPATS